MSSLVKESPRALLSPQRRADPVAGAAIGRPILRRVGPMTWWGLVAGAAALPVLVLLVVRHGLRAHPWYAASMVAALVAASLMVSAFVLPSRLRLLTRGLGVERLLRGHRALALLATGLVLVHIAVVLVHHGIGVLDLRHAPPRVWAASTATAALLVLVALGLTRRRRRPRYEGWRLVHVLLAHVALVGTALHVVWLSDLTRGAPGAAWFALLALVVLGVTAYRWLWRPRRARQRAYEVAEVRAESASAVTLVLHAIGHTGIRFRPGQFAWLKIGSSPHVFEEHPFTIASAATHPWRKEFTIKALGDFTELLAGLRPGRTVHLDGPHGSFTIDGLDTPGFVFCAGGVGITPMLSFLRTMAARGDRRPVVLVVAGRTADDLVHRGHLGEVSRGLDLRLVEVLEEPPKGWEGEVGRLDAQVLDGALPGRRMRRCLDYFVCGPPGMVHATTGLLRSWGVRRRRIHTELFDVV